MKDFDGWNTQKKLINSNSQTPTFKEREIWWCRLGVNIGHEEDGKGLQAHRPVLVLKKFNRQILWGIPLSTQIKDNPHYYHFEFLNKQQCALLTQLKLIDARRFNKKIGRLPEADFFEICSRIKDYIPKNKKPF
jgi:mRNA interferase MazF